MPIYATSFVASSNATLDAWEPSNWREIAVTATVPIVDATLDQYVVAYSGTISEARAGRHRFIGSGAPVGDQSVIFTAEANDAGGLSAMLRMPTNDANAGYEFHYSRDNNRMEIYRVVAGVRTLLAQGGTPSNPDTFTCSATGTNPVALSMSDGTTTVTYDDSDAARHEVGTPGIYVEQTGFSTATSYMTYYEIVGTSGDTLTIDSQPSTATSGVAMGNIVVESSDTASTATVTATIASGSGTLSGTTSVAMVAGVATFSNLIITGLGAFTLAFNATGHDEVVSSTITVSAPPAPPRVIVEFFRPS
jgi:hypothetical protein